MLSQARYCLEKYNLRWNPERKKFELPFDPNELNDYSFIEAQYLGKEKLCVATASGKVLDAAVGDELVYKNRLRKDSSNDPSYDIIALANKVLDLGTVCPKTNDTSCPAQNWPLIISF